jgi:phage shock protein PspC (stress-responsive transcriptional regulator)
MARVSGGGRLDGMEQRIDPTPSDSSPYATFAADPAPLPGAAPTSPRFTLRRSRTDRILSGVCGGLAQSLGVDPALLRVGIVALTLITGGAAAVVYAAAWVLAPEEERPAV